jgi:hypothetical protein
MTLKKMEMQTTTMEQTKGVNQLLLSYIGIGMFMLSGPTIAIPIARDKADAPSII